jgi:undecaprenyl-diphosphatase
MQNRNDSITRLMLPLLEMDRRGFLRVISVSEHISLKQSARFISRLGDGYLYIALALAIWWLDLNQGEDFLLAGVMAFSIELPLFLLLKNTIRRPRPRESIVGFVPRHKPSDEFSFPSGHTAAAFVFATLVAGFYPDFMFPAFIIAGLIGASRVVLGVHYPSDIAAGIVLGCGSAMTVLLA